MSRFTCLVISRQTGSVILSRRAEHTNVLDLEALAKLLAALQRFSTQSAASEALVLLHLCGRRIIVAPAPEFIVAVVLESSEQSERANHGDSWEQWIVDDTKIRAAIIRDLLRKRYSTLISAAVAAELDRVNHLIETDTAAQQMAYNASQQASEDVSKIGDAGATILAPVLCGDGSLLQRWFPDLLQCEQVLRVELRAADGTVLAAHTTSAGSQFAPYVTPSSAMHRLSKSTMSTLLQVDEGTCNRWSATYLSAGPSPSTCIVVVALSGECSSTVAGVVVYSSAAAPAEQQLPPCPFAALAAEAMRPLYFKSCVVTSQLPAALQPAVEACTASALVWLSAPQPPAATPTRPPRQFHASPNPLHAPAPPQGPPRRPRALNAVRNPRHAQLQNNELAPRSGAEDNAVEGSSRDDIGSPNSEDELKEQKFQLSRLRVDTSSRKSSRSRAKEEAPRGRAKEEAPRGRAKEEAPRGRAEALDAIRQQLHAAADDAHTEDEWSEGEASDDDAREHHAPDTSCLSPATEDEWSDVSAEPSPQPTAGALPLGVLEPHADDLGGWYEHPHDVPDEDQVEPDNKGAGGAGVGSKSVTTTPALKQVVGVPFDTAGAEQKKHKRADLPALPRNAWKTPRDPAAPTDSADSAGAPLDGNNPHRFSIPMRQPQFNVATDDTTAARDAVHAAGGGTARSKYDAVLDNGAHKFEFELHAGAATARFGRAASGLGQLRAAD